jgi:hypothetical protein
MKQASAEPLLVSTYCRGRAAGGWPLPQGAPHDDFDVPVVRPLVAQLVGPRHKTATTK